MRFEMFGCQNGKISEERIVRVEVVRRSIDARQKEVLFNLTIGIHIDRCEEREKVFIPAYRDVRGREDSEGEWLPMYYEVEDGDDTLNWIAGQPWSNGDAAMTGRVLPGICPVGGCGQRQSASESHAQQRLLRKSFCGRAEKGRVF